jgi:serine protease Do
MSGACSSAEQRAPKAFPHAIFREIAFKIGAHHIGFRLASGKNHEGAGKFIEMKRALLNLTFAGLGTLLGIVGMQFAPESLAKSDRTPPKIVVDEAEINREGSFATSFAPVIKKAAPSVVTILASHTVKQREMRNHPFFNNPLFRDLLPDQDRPRRPRSEKEEALGSGVIVSQDGYILTSNHVVEGADDIRIETAAGKEYTAKVIGTDPPTDTAVLKIEGADFPAITLANSDKLQVGDVCLAIGNPFGIGQTVTMGIVSATGRGELGIVNYEDFIQTDASINMGNSGGALVDAHGRLIGINTAILSGTGGNQGVGFAIPINMGRSVMESLVSQGKVSRGFLGIGLQPLNPELAERLELKDQGGALVAGVEEGFPAAEAGVKAGDLIMEFNGKKVAGDRQLRLMVSQTPPKSKATLKVLRNGKPKTIQVTLAELPNERTLSGMLRRGGEPDGGGNNETLEGVEVSDLDGRSRRQYSIPNNVRGALVTSVDPASKAAEKGLREGDVILEIERKPVTSADQAIEMSNNFKGKKILLRVWSRGSVRWVFVDVEQGDQKDQKDQSEKNDQDDKP